jgi:hypothetical protein
MNTTYDSNNFLNEKNQFFLSKQEKLLKIERQYKTSVFLSEEIKQITSSVYSYWDTDYKFITETKQSNMKDIPLAKNKEKEENNDSVINMLTSCGSNRKKDEDSKCILI